MARNFPFNIRQVAKILELRIRYENQNSGNLDADCPFCKKEGKLNLNAENNIFRCNYCDEKGGMVLLYGKVLGITNSEAYREICEILGCSKVKSVYADNCTSDGGGDAGGVQHSNAKITSRADCDTIHQTYSMLISMLNLASSHRDYLLGKGLSHDLIDSSGYKSVPAFGQRGLCVRLLQSGCTLEGVPGFYRDVSECGDEHRDGHSEWNVKLKAPGIIIPIRGIDGRISAIQIRLNKPVNGRKFIWLSSPDLDGGASSGSPIHFIGDPAAKRVYVTDRALKGTVSHGLSGYTFICLPGIKSIGGLDAILGCLKANGAREVIEAFDILKLTDNYLRAHAAKLREKIASCGLKVTSAVWGDSSLHGIGDYFLSRAKLQKNHVYDVSVSPVIGDRDERIIDARGERTDLKSNNLGFRVSQPCQHAIAV